MKLLVRLFFLSSVIVGILLYFYPEQFNQVITPASELKSTSSSSNDVSPAPLENQAVEEASIKETEAVRKIIEVIPLFVNGMLVEFSLESFHVDHVYYVARKYCEDNAASFGVTPDDLENSCTIIVFNNLFAKINEKKTALAQTQQSPQKTSPQQLKTARSSHDPTAASLIENNNDNGRPITMAPNLVQIKLPIEGGTMFSVSFDAAVQDPVSVATHFCNERAQELGLLSKLDIDNGCIPSISKYISDQLAVMLAVTSKNDDIIPQDANNNSQSSNSSISTSSVADAVSGSDNTTDISSSSIEEYEVQADN